MWTRNFIYKLRHPRWLNSALFLSHEMGLRKVHWYLRVCQTVSQVQHIQLLCHDRVQLLESVVVKDEVARGASQCPFTGPFMEKEASAQGQRWREERSRQEKGGEEGRGEEKAKRGESCFPTPAHTAANCPCSSHSPWHHQVTPTEEMEKGASLAYQSHRC